MAAAAAQPGRGMTAVTHVSVAAWAAMDEALATVVEILAPLQTGYQKAHRMGSREPFRRV